MASANITTEDDQTTSATVAINDLLNEENLRALGINEDIVEFIMEFVKELLNEQAENTQTAENTLGTPAPENISPS